MVRPVRDTSAGQGRMHQSGRQAVWRLHAGHQLVGQIHLTLHLPEYWHCEQEWLNLWHAACGPAAHRGLTNP
jgi:hypothetical protein